MKAQSKYKDVKTTWTSHEKKNSFLIGHICQTINCIITVAGFSQGQWKAWHKPRVLWWLLHLRFWYLCWSRTLVTPMLKSAMLKRHEALLETVIYTIPLQKRGFFFTYFYNSFISKSANSQARMTHTNWLICFPSQRKDYIGFCASIMLWCM